MLLPLFQLSLAKAIKFDWKNTVIILIYYQNIYGYTIYKIQQYIFVPYKTYQLKKNLYTNESIK